MGGNVFADKTSVIQRENITPTLNEYFSELSSIFPKKSGLFNFMYFILLGSAGKKSVSGDIDLGTATGNIIDLKNVSQSLQEWGLDHLEYNDEFELLKKRARTSNIHQLQTKAFLKLLATHINTNSKNIICDISKVTDGNMFTMHNQYDEFGTKLDACVQIDWMVGNVEWLKFSYYSDAYPDDSNIKGLHRTQLLLASFQVAGLSFNHVSGVKDKASGECVAVTPAGALNVLSARLNHHPFNITLHDAKNYYKLHALLKESMTNDQYQHLIKIYLKILDSTKVDIPDDLTHHWLNIKDELKLTGKFLPMSSKLREFL